MNRELIKKVRKAILAEPKRVDMRNFCRMDETCGTTGCIAGHVLFQAGLQEFMERASAMGQNVQEIEVAAGLLDVSRQDADDLFFFHTPTRIYDGNPYTPVSRKLRDTTPGTRAYARVVVEALDLFVNLQEEKGN